MHYVMFGSGLADAVSLEPASIALNPPTMSGERVQMAPKSRGHSRTLAQVHCCVSKLLLDLDTCAT